MSDDETIPFYSPHQSPAPPRQPTPGEPLFEFLRASDRRRVTCELRFHDESHGWEGAFLESGTDRFHRRGAFVTRALAAQWAAVERKALESSV